MTPDVIKSEAWMYDAGGGKYEVMRFPQVRFGDCVQPSVEVLEFGTYEEAVLYARSRGYGFGEEDPFAPGR